MKDRDLWLKALRLARLFLVLDVPGKICLPKKGTAYYNKAKAFPGQLKAGGEISP